jgi:mitochondrial inner membrane protease subunit 1
MFRNSLRSLFRQQRFAPPSPPLFKQCCHNFSRQFSANSDKYSTKLGKRFFSLKTKAKESPESDNVWLSSSAGEFMVGLVKFTAIVYCIQSYVIDITLCVGPSMLPTLNSAGDILLLSRFLHRYRPVEVNDVVVARSPSNPSQIVCKRVLGLEGDYIQYKRPRSGNMEFSYSKKGIVVPDGHIWLQGDNESNSTDSRHYGPVPEALVTGIALMRIWPFNAVGTLADKKRDKDGKYPHIVRIERKQYEHEQRMEKQKKREINKEKNVKKQEKNLCIQVTESIEI